ncbi:phytase [Gammaproteobacteria bacterium]|nr:phytase [Gammaproteobacteria bacterium]
MSKRYLFLFIVLPLLNLNADFQEISPKYETVEVLTPGDAADDPAIWFNAEQPSKSLIFGTDKRSGVHVYDLTGKALGFTELGSINNIDLRTLYNKNRSDTYFFVSNRTTQSIDMWAYKDSDIRLDIIDMNFALAKEPLIQMLSNINIYGICAGNDPQLGLIVFATEDGGPSVELWQYSNNTLKLLTTFSNNGESEGCVYDDENRTLFISEENTNGVLKAYQVNDSLDFDSAIIIDSRAGNIGGDPEGVAIYKTSLLSGYVVLSSQGDSKYNLYNREAPYNYIDSFRVGNSLYAAIDGTSDTDGVAILSNNLNRDFPMGIMVVQDGYNFDKDQAKNQNFKYLSFKDIIKKLKL